MKSLFLFLLLLPPVVMFGQKDSLKKHDKDLSFTGTRINPYSVEYDTSGKIKLSAYIDTYYAFYSDTVGSGGFQKFPTTAPRSDQFGLNIAQVSARYQSDRFRGIATLFWGDCPQSAWSPHLNLIQEANLGFRIAKGLWFDAGFFRTHIGLESIQPRENVTMSFATTTYFEPYYMAGAKLTYELSPTLVVQLNAFNGFNAFAETNSNKAVGVSAAWTPGEHFNLSFSSLASDESADDYPLPQMRLYNNLYMVYKTNRFTLGVEGNFGLQQNTKLSDSSATAMMYSTLIAAKYRVTTHWGVYSRFEFFDDPDEILTGPVYNDNHQLAGMKLIGFTAGTEYKPIPNSYLRIESRVLQAPSDEKIFYYNAQSSNIRWEVICGLGFWF